MASIDTDSLIYHVVRDKRAWWSAPDVSALLGVTTKHVYELIYSGDLEALSFGVRKKGYRPDRTAKSAQADLFERADNDPLRAMRIPRRALVKYIMESRCGETSPEEYTVAVCGILRDLPPAAIRAIREHCKTLLTA